MSEDNETKRAKPKPPPIQVGVKGVDDSAEQEAKRLEAQKLAELSRLPPFQMFIAEIEGGGVERPNAQQFALERAQALSQTARKQSVLDEYKAWHSDKGLWPHETYDGRPR